MPIYCTPYEGGEYTAESQEMPGFTCLEDVKTMMGEPLVEQKAFLKYPGVVYTPYVARIDPKVNEQVNLSFPPREKQS